MLSYSLMRRVMENGTEAGDNAVTCAVVKAVASGLVPALKELIMQEAVFVAAQFDETGPIAISAAANLVLRELSDFLVQDVIEDADQYVSLDLLTPAAALDFLLPPGVALTQPLS